jgi:hypothetical protein
METAFLEQLFNIAQRKRVAKIPPDGTKDEAGFGLPPLEDRGSGYHFAILSRHQPATLNVATHPLASRETVYALGYHHQCCRRPESPICETAFP